MTDKEIVALYNNGWLKRHIRDTFNLSLVTVEKALKDIPGAISLPEESICLQIIADYQKGELSESVRSRYKISNVTLNNIFYHYGIKKIRRRKRNITNDFFETIDNEINAYWLGFLFADGYNDETSGCIELALASKDRNHLLEFKKAIGSGHPLIDRRVNGYDSCRLSFSCREMSDDLAKHGCVKAKSLVLKYPTTVPEHLTHHFIRGYFDGDGSVMYNKNTNRYNTSLVGTEEFLNEVCRQAQMTQTKLTKKGNAYTLQHGGRKNILKLHNYLYNDATIFMSRKKDIFTLSKLPSSKET